MGGIPEPICCTSWGPGNVYHGSGMEFNALEFQDYLQTTGIDHKRTTPYHPQSDGNSERAVKTTSSTPVIGRIIWGTALSAHLNSTVT